MTTTTPSAARSDASLETEMVLDLSRQGELFARELKIARESCPGSTEKWDAVSHARRAVRAIREIVDGGIDLYR